MSLGKSLKGSEGRLNNAVLAEITSVGLGAVSIYGLGEVRDIPLISPYGILWCPTTDVSAEVIKNLGRDKHAVCTGVINPIKKSIQPGELYLFSKGGASIYLKNDGTIVMNDHFIIKPDGQTERV